MPGPPTAAAPIVGLAGPVGPSRRTTTLVGAVLVVVAARLGCPTRLIDLQDDRLPPCDGRAPDAYGSEADAVIAAVRAAPALVIGTPVYRATFSAVLKNALEVIPPDAFAGIPALMVVSGGSRDHYLVADYALRPVLAHIGVDVLATPLYVDPPLMPDGTIGAELEATIAVRAAELAAAVEVQRTTGSASAGR